MNLPPALWAYRAASAALGVLAPAWLDARARGGKEEVARLGERLGRYGFARPEGALCWLHAASVGEAGVALLLAEALATADPGFSFLISTGTRTSATLVARRAGPRTRHVYAPLDREDAVRRFYAHWRPDLGVLIESELWPNLILEAQASNVPLALVNARMSASSLRRWRQWSASGRRLLQSFAFVSAADARTGEALAELRRRDAPTLGNLKLAAPAPSIDAAACAHLTGEVGARPLWLAASTHAGEEEILLAAHARLRAQHPDALLVIVPRHPERGERIAALANRAPRRALGAPIGDAAVYIADTLGELGLFYAAAPAALIAGSLLPDLKGHNPIEAAKLDCAMLSGPYVESFEDLFAALSAVGGVETVRTAEDIAIAIASLWRDEPARRRRIDAARAAVSAGDTALKTTVSALLSLRRPDARA